MMRYPRLRQVDQRGELCASDALILCFYLPHSNTRIAPAVVRALELLRERIHPYVFGRYVDDGQARPLDDASWRRLRESMLAPASDECAFLQLEGNSAGMDALHVDYRGLSTVPLPWPERQHDVSVLYARLPTEYLEERGPDSVRALALELAAELPFSSGYVDFALCASPRDFSEALPLIHPRLPGVHLAANRALLRMNTWVEGVHWMNFLGPPVLDLLGGVASVRARMSLPGASIQELGVDRLLITLGERPEPGDPLKDQTLSPRRALARLLEPHLHHWRPSETRVDAQTLLRWERRFLD